MNYSLLFKKLNEFINKQISYSDLKSTAANYGIYQQKDGKFMARIRITGGEVSSTQLSAIYNIVEKYNPDFIHLTSRQDIQLHGLDIENIIPLINECTKNKMPFRGGGGDTFRNIAVSYNSGLSDESVFNVLPFAKQLTEIMFKYDKAFDDLPRKLKIVISCNKRDNALAKIQDLGFIAKIKDGRRGFEVYGGGGMGNQSSPGIQLLDFINDADVYKCALAMTDFFYDHGDRSSRSKARIRFILKKLGTEKFKQLFLDYYNNIDIEIENCFLENPELQFNDIFLTNLQKPSDKLSKSEAEIFSKWKNYAITKTKFKDISLVKLFIPYGNLKLKELKRLVQCISSTGIHFVRLSREETIYMPVHNNTLESVFKQLLKLGYTVNSLKGQITTCIGTKICPIGIINTHEFSDNIGKELDSYFEDNTDKKKDFLNNILEEIKISGCPNSCSNHHAFLLGFQGIRKKNIHNIPTDYCKIFIGGNTNSLGLSPNDLLLDSKQIGKYVTSIIKDYYIQKEKNKEISFKDFLSISENNFFK